MKQNRIVRMSVGGSSADIRQTARAVKTLIKDSGWTVEIVDRGDPEAYFEARSAALIKGTTDCILVPGIMPSQTLAEGISLTAVLPRQSPRMCLLTVSGLTRPTVTNPTGLDRHAIVGVPSSGQYSQLAAIGPDLHLVEISSATRPEQLLRKRKFDAVLVAHQALGVSERKNFDLIELCLEIMLPPPGLGTAVILTRTDDPLGTLLKSLDDQDARSCLMAERLLADTLGRPAGLACLATIDTDGSIRLQATLPREALDPRSALVRVGASAPTPEAVARSCRFALEECAHQPIGK